MAEILATLSIQEMVILPIFDNYGFFHRLFQRVCLDFISSVSPEQNSLCHKVRVPALFVYSGWWLKNHIIILNLVMWNWIFNIFFSKLVLCLIGFEVEICKQHQAIYRFLHFNYFKRIIRLHPIYSCKREILSFLKV